MISKGSSDTENSALHHRNKFKTQKMTINSSLYADDKMYLSWTLVQTFQRHLFSWKS